MQHNENDDPEIFFFKKKSRRKEKTQTKSFSFFYKPAKTTDTEQCIPEFFQTQSDTVTEALTLNVCMCPG